jgi:hypothetical protein
MKKGKMLGCNKKRKPDTRSALLRLFPFVLLQAPRALLACSIPPLEFSIGLSIMTKALLIPFFHDANHTHQRNTN